MKISTVTFLLMVASAASQSATADPRPSSRGGDDDGGSDGKAFVLFEGQRLRSRRRAKAKLVEVSSLFLLI